MDIASVRKGPVGLYLRKLNDLRNERIKLIQQQNEVARELTSLTSVYKSNSSQVIKNLEAAVSVSRRPGYIGRFQPSTHIYRNIFIRVCVCVRVIDVHIQVCYLKDVCGWVQLEQREEQKKDPINTHGGAHG